MNRYELELAIEAAETREDIEKALDKRLDELYQFSHTREESILGFVKDVLQGEILHCKWLAKAGLNAAYGDNVYYNNPYMK